MDHLLPFLLNHPLLVGAFLTLLYAFIHIEGLRSGKKLSPREATALVNTRQARIVDLRDAASFRKGHIVDAINLPYSTAVERFSEIGQDKTLPVILVCEMGQHAGAVGRHLRHAGYEVYRLDGGLNAWRGDNLPLVKKK